MDPQRKPSINDGHHQKYSDTKSHQNGSRQEREISSKGSRPETAPTNKAIHFSDKKKSRGSSKTKEEDQLRKESLFKSPKSTNPSTA